MQSRREKGLRFPARNPDGFFKKLFRGREIIAPPVRISQLQQMVGSLGLKRDARSKMSKQC